MRELDKYRVQTLKSFISRFDYNLPLSDIKGNWNELLSRRTMLPSHLVGLGEKRHLGIPINNAPPLLSGKFTDLSCNACRNTVHFLLCRKIPFCSTDILFPVCWGSAQPYVIYWAWLHCQCCFPSIINNYNAGTSLIFIVHSLHFILKWISARILVSADATLCSAGLTNFFWCNCGTLNQEGACEDAVSRTLLSHHRPQCHFCQRRRRKTLPFQAISLGIKGSVRKKPRKWDGITTR